MAVAAPQQAVIDGNSYTLHPNKKEPRSPFKRLADAMDTANTGPFRLGQLGDRFFKFLNTVTPNENFRNISTMFNRAWTVTIIPRLFSVNYTANETVNRLIGEPNDEPAARRRQYVAAIHDVTDAATAWGYASSLFLACFKKTAELSLSVLKAAEIVTFVHDIADGQMNAEDWNKARVAAIRADQIRGAPEMEAVHSNLIQTQRFHALKTCKAVCSIAGFVLGLSLAATGLVLPGIAITAASISLASTIFAMSAELYKESMANSVVKFFDNKHVAPI